MVTESSCGARGKGYLKKKKVERVLREKKDQDNWISLDEEENGVISEAENLRGRANLKKKQQIYIKMYAILYSCFSN